MVAAGPCGSVVATVSGPGRTVGERTVYNTPAFAFAPKVPFGAAAMMSPRDARTRAVVRTALGDSEELRVPSRAADGNAAQLITPPIVADAATTAST